jgi:acyl-coenzyme A thioesterase PaaI-like protein
MKITTHLKIDAVLCGRPSSVSEGKSRVTLLALENMTADDTGLVHGGFVFGLADYAAMICVNHPNVVLGGAEVKFLRPVKVNDTLVADAVLEQSEGKKRMVRVTVKNSDQKVFEGNFSCFVPDRHVLS